MKKATERVDDLDDEVLPSYENFDLGKPVRGKLFKKYWAGQNVAVLAADVRAAFPTDADVDKALRSLMSTKASA